MTKWIAIFTFLLSFGAHSQETPSLSFMDSETRSASDVDVGSGLRAILDLPLMPKNQRLDIEVLILPEFKMDEAPLYERQYRNERSDEEGLWRKTFRIPSFHNKEELLRRFGRVARLRLSWKDPASDQSGTLIRKFYLLENKKQKFFKILNPGDLRVPNHADPESICSYRKSVEVVGPYLQNPSLAPQEYEFNQSVALESLRYRGPLNETPLLSWDYVNKIAAPFQILDEGDLGWLMTGWSHYEGSETKLSFKPKILLQAAQGGYFVKETLVKRFKAQKYSFQKKLGISEWLTEETGFLDVGSTQYDFITLAFEDSQNPALLEQNLQDRAALLSTCTIYPEEKDRVYHTGEHNSLHEELFFVVQE